MAIQGGQSDFGSVSMFTIEDQVAVLTIDSPPVNALGHPVRCALDEGIARALAEPDVRALVIICAGRTFFAGADIRELGKPILPPLLQDLIRQLEGAQKPTIAAMHGNALGGGFELALGCDYRIAANGTRIGLPEAHLGLLPGAGGTQRVPRLIGVAAAARMIALGETYDAAQALELGLIDRVAGEDLKSSAIRFAKEVLGQGWSKRRVRDLEVYGEVSALDDFRTAHPHLFVHLKAPAAILEAIRAAANCDFDEGMELERSLSKTLVASPQSAAQRHIFFAERSLSKLDAELVRDIEARLRASLDQSSRRLTDAGASGVSINQALGDFGFPVETTQDVGRSGPVVALDEVLGSVVAEAHQLAREGLSTAAIIDAIAVKRLGWPVHTGGPIFWSEHRHEFNEPS